ncbi:COG3677: Transposase and inactivated derivatives [Richelia intracellularis]|nr:COG3677: Transposase and inactivated derivatives [Richelia intracellularis]
MHYSYCKSTKIRKNGKRRGKQNHISVNCERQFINIYNPPKGYSNESQQECLKA